MTAAANVQLLCSLNGKTKKKKNISTNRHKQQRQVQDEELLLCESMMKNTATYVRMEKKKPRSMNLVSLTY